MQRIILLITLFFLVSCGPNKYLPHNPPQPIPPFCVPGKIRVALVLGSGGVRGMAHVGVIEELTKAGIPIDIIVGCSAGSVVGALYADNPDIKQLKKAVSQIKCDTLLDINIWECRYGLSQGKSMHKVLNKYLHARDFCELKKPLIVVASDLYTGELIPIGSGNLIQGLQASCSIPFVFTPCRHMGRILVDGGVICPVPVKVARDLCPDMIIAVDLCELLPKTCPSNLFEIATRSAEIGFMWQNEACSHHADVVIRPRTCDVGTFNDDKKLLLYHAGRKAARDAIPRIQEILAEKSDAYFEGHRIIFMPPYVPQIYMN